MQSDLLQQMLTQNHEKQLRRNANNERLVNEATRRNERSHLGRKIVSTMVTSFQNLSIRRTAVTPTAPQAADASL